MQEGRQAEKDIKRRRKDTNFITVYYEARQLSMSLPVPSARLQTINQTTERTHVTDAYAAAATLQAPEGEARRPQAACHHTPLTSAATRSKVAGRGG